MNQTPRWVYKKCIECGKETLIKEVYDKHLSMYVSAQMPMCDVCKEKVFGKRNGG